MGAPHDERDLDLVSIHQRVSDGNKIKVRFGEVTAGWVSVALHIDGVPISCDASYICPGFADLVSAVQSMLSGGDKAVTWNEEPREQEWRFCRDSGGDVSLEIWQFPDYHRTEGSGTCLAAATGTYESICLPFWRALRELRARYSDAEWRARWRYPFPSDELDRLTNLLRERRIIR